MKNKLLSLLAVGFLGLPAQQAFALGCSTYTSGALLGPVSSFQVPSIGEQIMSGGLSCEIIANLLSTQYIKYKVMDIPAALIHENGINQAKIIIRDSQNTILSNDFEKDLSEWDWLSIFGGPDNSIPFKITVNETTNLKPGVYKGVLKMKWYYHIGAIGIGGVNLWTYHSPGTLWLPLAGLVRWGTGEDSNVPLQLIVEKDCNINAQNINFGKAPLVSKFNPVTGTVQITCSAETPYSVGLSDGQNFDQTRRMLNTIGSGYLPYEIYKNTTTTPERWGHLGTERWSSADATLNPGKYDGSAAQGYAYTAKIIDDGSNPSVVGTYKDTLTIEVAF